MASEKFTRAAESLLRECAEQTGDRLGSLVGGEVQFGLGKISPLSAADYSLKNRKKAAVLMMESNGDGHAMVLVRFQEAILLAGTLLMMPANQIKETIKSGEMGQDLTDAFNEVANIVYGAIDELTHGMSPENGKLRNEGVQLVDASRGSDLGSCWPAGPTWSAELSMTFPGFEEASAFLVFDEALLALVTGIPPVDEAPAAEPGSAEVLLFGTDAGISADLKGYLAEKGIGLIETDDAGKAVEMLAGKPAMVVAEFRAGAEEAVESLCASAARKAGIPVVGVSANPTRETILLAKKTGVKAFLVHPFTADALRTKLAPCLSACVKS